MEHIEITQSAEMLFALLRASLHENNIEISYFQEVTSEDWKQCYLMAVRQGVMVLAWDGVIKLPNELQPPKHLKITWAIGVEKYEEKYERYCSTIKELSDFYSQYGIQTIQIKGVGLSSFYPCPSHREGGDIDIFTYSKDKSKMTDKEANHLANSLMLKQGIKVDIEHNEKHGVFNYNGITIENHLTFLDVGMYKFAVTVEEVLHKLLQPQLTNLLNGKYQIYTPSIDFNMLYIPFHAAQHYGDGLALHHLCDWACLIKRCDINFPQEISDKSFLKGVNAMTYLCNKYLGTSTPVKPDKDLSNEMLNEILNPRFEKKIPETSKLGIIRYKIMRFIHRMRLNNHILYIPLWRRIWISVVMHLKFPNLIFDRKKNKII